MPTVDVPGDEFPGETGNLVDWLVRAGLATSRGQARKDMEGGGIYVNNVRAEAGRSLSGDDLLFGRYMLLRKGRKSYAVVRLT